MNFNDPSEFGKAFQRLVTDPPEEVREAFEADQLAEDNFDLMTAEVFQAPDGEHFEVAYVREDGIRVTDQGRWLSPPEEWACAARYKFRRKWRPDMCSLKDLTSNELQALDEDILQRLTLQRAMAANTRAVLELELGISDRTISNIEAGQYEHICPPYKVSAEIRREVRARRKLWHMGNEAMQGGFTIEALVKRHRVSSRVIENRIRYLKTVANRVEVKAA